jgi:hypothetical protein
VTYGFGLAALLGAAATGLYAFFVEPYWVQLTAYSLPGTVSEPLRIAHLSDLHTRGFGLRERRVLALVERAAPDIVVLTGDTIDGGSLEPSRELLRRLRAPLGVWVVRGDHDPAAHFADDRAFYRSVGAHFLDNEGAAVRPDVWLLGLDDPATGTPEIGRALAGAPAAAFKVALFHAPDYFAEVAGLFDLGLAGHTHGGQVRIPGLAALRRPPHGRRYVSGWYTQNDSKLFVSRGLGTSEVRARLLCRPEVAIIEIRPN